MAAQSRHVFANIRRVLAAAGARPEQVTKLTIFVANYKREHLAEIEAGRVALFGDHKPTDTLVGVGGAVAARLHAGGRRDGRGRRWSGGGAGMTNVGGSTRADFTSAEQS